jgi:multidrug efflux system membrane fusion protein
LGQFSPVNRVELRAQVGGTLVSIGFKDGDVVRKGDLLFEIDPTPYEIKLAQATAQLKGANARMALASRELERAIQLKRSNAVSAQDVDQRTAEKEAAQASIDEAEARIRDAKFDLDHTRITAPFSGQIGSHLVSAGNLIAGSRSGGSATTLLATLVSLNPVYFDFDMSEADYLRFLRQREERKGPVADKVMLALGDETSFDHTGTLDFVDNVIDRSSGTIRARATVSNDDQLFTPGAFGRVRVAVSAPQVTLLVPDASVMPDQSKHIVLTVGQDNVVKAKQVEVGDLRGGLRVVQAGLAVDDKVVIEGMAIAAPGVTITPVLGKIEFQSE